MKWSRFKWPWPSFYRCSPRRASRSRTCLNQKSPPFEFARPERVPYGCFISAVTRTAMKRPAGILTAFVCVSHGGSNISLRPEGSTGTLFFTKTTRTGRMPRPSIRLILKNVCDSYFCVQPRSLDLKAGTFTLNPFGNILHIHLGKSPSYFSGKWSHSRIQANHSGVVFFFFVFFVVVVLFVFFAIFYFFAIFSFVFFFVVFFFFCGL